MERVDLITLFAAPACAREINTSRSRFCWFLEFNRVARLWTCSVFPFIIYSISLCFGCRWARVTPGLVGRQSQGAQIDKQPFKLGGQFRASGRPGTFKPHPGGTELSFKPRTSLRWGKPRCHRAALMLTFFSSSTTDAVTPSGDSNPGPLDREPALHTAYHCVALLLIFYSENAWKYRWYVDECVYVQLELNAFSVRPRFKRETCNWEADLLNITPMCTNISI